MFVQCWGQINTFPKILSSGKCVQKQWLHTKSTFAWLALTYPTWSWAGPEGGILGCHCSALLVSKTECFYGASLTSRCLVISWSAPCKNNRNGFVPEVALWWGVCIHTKQCRSPITMLNLCWHYIHGTDNLRVLDAFHLHAMGIFYLFFYNKDERHPPRKKKKKKSANFCFFSLFGRMFLYQKAVNLPAYLTLMSQWQLCY